MFLHIFIPNEFDQLALNLPLAFVIHRAVAGAPEAEGMAATSIHSGCQLP